jgi:hypothetical protein
MVDPEIALRLQPYLAADERIVWTGRPPAGLMLTGQDVFLIPFSLLWGGFAIFWEVGASAAGGGIFFALWGIPFVMMGIYMIVGRFFVDAWLRKGTVYGLTGRRALVLRSRPGERLNATPTGGSVRVAGRKGEEGTLEFGPPLDIMSAMRGFSIWMPSLSDQVRFYKVGDVMAAYKIANLST